MTNTATMRRKYLRQELKNYVSTRDLTPDEHAELKAWVAAGNSVYDNARGACGENGWPLDYISAERIMKDLCERIEADEQIWPACDCGDPILDAPL